MESLLSLAKKFVPKRIFRFFQPMYHWLLAYAAVVIYRFPAQKLKVIGITGTNGKSTVVAMLSAILEEAGKNVSSISSLRFKIRDREWKNTLKMTMPGRFKFQKFLRDAVLAKCEYAVVEVTSEGIKQFRHKGISFFMAILTNVTLEHIESHGSFEKYLEAKAKLFYGAKIHVLNREDKNFEFFRKIPAQKKVFYSKNYFPTDFHLKLLGEFNKENAATAYAAARELGISEEKIKSALEKIEFIPGRLEYIQREPFSVVVDYAHTPDALEKVYKTLRFSCSKMICVLGAAGGGRDKWKRSEMGKISAEHCDEIILTNEDPYDEPPEAILDEIASGFKEILNKHVDSKKIIDRKLAIREALNSATIGDIVIITGKGAEPWIMGPNGQKISWDDRDIVREELKNLEQ